MHRTLSGLVGRHTMRTALLALALAIGNLVTAHAADVVVTTCGTVVPSGDKGTLQANLDCRLARGRGRARRAAPPSGRGPSRRPARR